MLQLDMTLPTPAENLALDEALLETAEAEGDAAEYLRLWESPVPCVVIGRASRLAGEVREFKGTWDVGRGTSEKPNASAPVASPTSHVPRPTPPSLTPEEVTALVDEFLKSHRATRRSA